MPHALESDFELSKQSPRQIELESALADSKQPRAAVAVTYSPGEPGKTRAPPRPECRYYFDTLLSKTPPPSVANLKVVFVLGVALYNVCFPLYLKGLGRARPGRG